MRQDFLFEIGTEELPPKALPKLAQAFETQVVAALKEQQFEHGEVKLYYTPRRIALFITGLTTEQPEQLIEKRGPSTKVAYDAAGKPTPALQGFLNSCQITADKLETLETDKGAWVMYSARQRGAKASELLPSIIAVALNKLPIPKLMRWGSHEFQFVRPVHWLIMLLGDKIIKAEMFGCKTDRITYGHRVHHPDAISIDSPDQYAAVLSAKAKVIVDPQVRQKVILAQAQKLAESVAGEVVWHEALLAEVSNIVEWPVALLGEFAKDLLQVPHEALIGSMQSHQKAFAITDKAGQLQPYFIVISNLVSTAPAIVVKGNEKVIAARLADAKFFFAQDLKTPLIDHLASLAKVTFQHKLGSWGDQAQIIDKVASKIAGLIKVDIQQVSRAAILAKCDLMSEMVQEFPSLQGIMGKHYALASGENKIIAQAIQDHYQPNFSGDNLPTSEVGDCVALADKLVTLVGIFGIGLKPTGTKDPYKLRRAAIGVLRILIEKQYDLDVAELLEFTAKQYGTKLTMPDMTVVHDYILERLRTWYHDQDIAYDIFDAVIAVAKTNLADLDLRIHAIKAFIILPQAEAFIAANKRIRNILKNQNNFDKLPVVNESLLAETAELELYNAMLKLEPDLNSMLKQREYKKYLSLLAGLQSKIDVFFDNVMVMADDQTVRANRLALLVQLRSMFIGVADLSLAG